MNLSKDKVTEIFYFADNFCKEFYKSIEAHAIEESGKARREPRRKPKMSSGEVITIMVLFHYDGEGGSLDGRHAEDVLSWEACDKVRGGDHQPTCIVLNVSTACRLNHAATSVAAMLAVASY